MRLSEIIFRDDYKTQLAEIIEDYRDIWRSYAADARITVIDSLIDRYIEHTGERPDGRALYQLGSIIAYDYMEGDMRKNKASVEEYPILTDRQLAIRKTGARESRGVQGVVNFEVPLDNATNIGSDGADYSPPIRRY